MFHSFDVVNIVLNITSTLLSTRDVKVFHPNQLIRIDQCLKFNRLLKFGIICQSLIVIIRFKFTSMGMWYFDSFP